MSEETPAAETAHDEDVLVVDVPEHRRFEITVGGQAAGFAEYVDAAPDEGQDPVRRTFPHTVIDEEYGGRGLATHLIRTALDSTRAKAMLVVPECPAVRHFIDTHPDYADLVAP